MDDAFLQVIRFINRQTEGNGLYVVPGDFVLDYGRFGCAAAVFGGGGGGEVPFYEGGACY